MLSRCGEHHADIVLIDARKLTELMISFNLGVSDHKEYVVKKIDYDYFEVERVSGFLMLHSFSVTYHLAFSLTAIIDVRANSVEDWNMRWSLH